MWTLICLLSPQAARRVKALVAKTLTEHSHPEIGLLTAPREQYRQFVPAELEDREAILQALAQDHSLFNRKQIAIMLASFHEGEKELYPADEDTVRAAIKEAGIAPVFGMYFESRQITHRLLPCLLNRRKTWKRYVDFKNDLLTYGIDVPDTDVIERN